MSAKPRLTLAKAKMFDRLARNGVVSGKEALKAIDAHLPLTSIILCCNSIETLLAMAFLLEESKFQATSVGKGRRKLTDWSLAQYVKVATELKILDEEGQKVAQTVVKYRRLIHPMELATKNVIPSMSRVRDCGKAMDVASKQLRSHIDSLIKPSQATQTNRT